MMNKVQGSRLMQYKAAEAVTGGQLVALGAESPFVAVAVTDIAVGQIGIVDPDGVFVLPKGAGALAQGQALYLGADGKVSATAGDTYVGRAFRAAASGDTAVEVILNAFPPAAGAAAAAEV